MTEDVDEAIQIDENEITLDGNGYEVIGTSLTGDGVYLYERTGVTIQNLNVHGFSNGIFLEKSNDNTLTDNNAWDNKKMGIYLKSSCSNNTLTGNNAWGNYRGIFLKTSCSNNTLMGNSVWDNLFEGIYLLTDCKNNTLRGNDAFNNKFGIVIRGNADNNTLTGNNASNNTQTGIRLHGSHNNTLTGNDASNNTSGGIRLVSGAENNNLAENIISGNISIGIYIEVSNYNTMTGNTISNNGWGAHTNAGLSMINSTYNKVYNNNFINNEVAQVIVTGTDSTTHEFNMDSPIGGNYWSDWTAPDNDGDGFVDAPYVIDISYMLQDDFPWVVQDGWLSPQVLIQNLIAQVEGLNLQQGIDNSLDSKLENALAALDAANAGQRQDAVNKIQAFVNAINAQRGNKIGEADADALIVSAQHIIEMLNAG